MLSLPFAIAVFGAGVLAGGVGGLLGLGGGVFLVPILNLALGFPLRTAAAISLATVIAASSSVSAAASRAGADLINLRLGTVLETTTVAGSLTGGLLAHRFAETTLQRFFGVMAIVMAAAVFARAGRRNVILDPAIDTGRLGGRFHDRPSGGVVSYRVRRLPLALGASFVAGGVSSLLGVGGGIIKVPVLNAWCGVPLRVASSTSAYMIGVTALSGAIIYYGRGDLAPLIAAPAVLGVQLGSRAGLHVAERAPAMWLKILLGIILLIVAALMFARSLT